MRSEHAPSTIALVGTRGIPARYGGFETAVEEIGRRLVNRGHSITVYGREPDGNYLGMESVRVRSSSVQQLETLTRSVSSARSMRKRTFDAAIIFNVASAPLLRLFDVPVKILNVDGLESQRSKWSRLGRRYFRACERVAARSARAGRVVLVADSGGIAAYYRQRYGVRSEVVPYGAPEIKRQDYPAALLPESLIPNQFYLVVARLEPENQVHIAVEAYAKSRRRWPLVVVGDNAYDSTYARELTKSARHAGAIMTGRVDNQVVLNALYAHAGAYIHGHSVGGTNPSLLRAHGAGAPILNYDCVFNREVSRDSADYWSDSTSLAQHMDHYATSDPRQDSPESIRQDILARYDWDRVTDDYERLALGG